MTAPASAQEAIATLLQHHLDLQSDKIMTRIQIMLRHELDVSLKNISDSWQAARLVEASSIDDSTSSGNVGSPGEESNVDCVPPNCMPECRASEQQGQPDESQQPPDFDVGDDAPVMEVQRLRRRSSVGVYGVGRPSQMGAAEIRHSLMHSVAELDMQHANQQSFRQSVFAMLASPALNQTESWAVDHEHHSWLTQVRLSLQRKIVETTWFEGLVVACIGLNTIMIGAASDWNLRHIHQEEPKHFRVAERLFAGMFAVELFVRIFAYGPAFFWRLAPRLHIPG